MFALLGGAGGNRVQICAIDLIRIKKEYVFSRKENTYSF
jgi:hypothetical protein